MATKVWTLDKDPSIKCQQLTPQYLEDAVNTMEDAFIRCENVCKAIGLPQDPEAITELNQLIRAVAKDGVSIIAVDQKTDKVVACAINKLQVQDTSGEPPFFEVFAKSCTQPRSIAVLEFMKEIDGMCDLFDLCQVDCLLEIMFLGTLPDYRGKGIGKRLCEVSLEVGKELLQGGNIKVSVEVGKEVPLEPIPKAASAIFTSFITQRIGRQLHFQIAVEKSYAEFEYEGRRYDSVIGKETQGLTLEYKKF